MEAIDDCREEIQKQFDVRFLFERLDFLERSLSHLFNDNQTRFLHLLRKPTIKDASERRENYRFKGSLISKGVKNEQ
jgi:hypothetical protein